MTLTPTQRRLVGLVVTGAVLIAGIGFVGSYAAVRSLAEAKGFGDFALVFPIGIDAGITVLLALDLLLTWLRIPFPLLRQAAWLLTAATIAFNAAAAWPDPVGTGMHAVIPLLFVVVIEAARHATGRVANITAGKHMDRVRLSRWVLSPLPTFKLWRRMKLWELRSYEQVIQAERDRLVYTARLEMTYGRGWRRKASAAERLPLRLARYGSPLQPVAASFETVADEAVAVATPAPEPPALPPAQRAVAAAATPPRNAVHETVAPPLPIPATPVPPQASEVQLLSTADVARIKEVETGSVRSWVHRGLLTPVRRDRNGRMWFHPDDVAAFTGGNA